jgi:3-keto-5-aminohexanoate cleavage enzyme
VAITVDYKDIPPRIRGERAGFDFPGQPKWEIPEACVIKAAVVGRPPGRKGSPVPNNPGEVPTDAQMKEIVRQSMDCIDAGACCIHYHAVGVTPDDWIKDWMRFVDPIKAKYGDNIVFDLSLCTRDKWEDEMYLIDKMNSICEFTPCNISLSGTGQAKKFLQAEFAYCQEKGVKPEIAMYFDGDIDRAKAFLVDTGVLKMPAWWDWLPTYTVGGTPMYNFTSMALTVISHVQQIRQITPNSQIMYTGSGRASSHLAAVAIMMGCHIKVGMEDVYFQHPNSDAPLVDNVKSVENAVTLVKSLGRRPATANEMRAFAGLPLRGKGK